MRNFFPDFRWKIQQKKKEKKNKLRFDDFEEFDGSPASPFHFKKPNQLTTSRPLCISRVRAPELHTLSINTSSWHFSIAFFYVFYSKAKISYRIVYKRLAWIYHPITAYTNSQHDGKQASKHKKNHHTKSLIFHCIYSHSV